MHFWNRISSTLLARKYSLVGSVCGVFVTYLFFRSISTLALQNELNSILKVTNLCILHCEIVNSTYIVSRLACLVELM